MSSRKVVLLDEARIDLRDIVRYTRRQWNREQSDMYMQKFRSAFRRLSSYPELGRRRPEYGADIRSLSDERHRIFYVVSPTSVEIMRIVHVKTGDPDLQVEKAWPSIDTEDPES